MPSRDRVASRRAFLAGLSVGTALVAGCVAERPAARPGATTGTADDPATDGSTTPSTVEYRLEVPGFEAVRPSTPPSVAFDPENDRVVVTGAMRYGSSSCSEIGVRSVDYADRRLRAVVVAREKSGAGPTCTGELASTPYTLLVRFPEGKYPETVEVTEIDDRGDEQARVATPSGEVTTERDGRAAGTDWPTPTPSPTPLSPPSDEPTAAST